ncbi:MAG: PAS domain S-box protein [Desulfuromonadales bacterium]|nr:PAS domain S-box protein [Desulfuromonadales bacterium]
MHQYETKYRSFFEHSANAMLIIENGEFVDCNAAAVAMLGYDQKEELISTPPFQLSPEFQPDGRRSFDKAVEMMQLAIDKGNHQFEWEHLKKDGSVLPVEVSLTAIESEDGMQLHTLWHDISERKRSEKLIRDQIHAYETSQRLLRDSEERFKMLNEASFGGVFIYVDGLIIDCNQRLCEMTGFRYEELVGSDGFKMIAPDWHDLVKKHIKINYDQRYEVVGVRNNGTAYPLAIRGKKVAYKGHAARLVEFRDLSERKRVEAELQKLEKLESIGTLAGGIAHDFNNILTGLYGNITLARMKLAVDHPGLRYLEAAEQSMQRASFLTSQLLTFAKGGAPVKKSLSLGGLVEEVVNFNLAGSNVRAMIKPADKLWSVRADHGQIQQVFASLTTNARQAMPDGGHLHVSLENATLADNAVHGLDAGNYLRITITDEGVGIAPEHLDRIFEPYFTTKESGSGLGLATTYSIIDKHNGHISVISRPGKGTTFTLYLPACALAETLAEHPETAAAPAAQLSRVLVMDDEEMIRGLLREMLEESGFAVETAAEGLQAIKLYRQAMDAGKPFAVVILDLTVPGGMGGQDAAEGILRMDQKARIIVSSGYADDPVMANFADYGFKGVAPKPYRLDELSGVLAEVLEDR